MKRIVIISILVLIFLVFQGCAYNNGTSNTSIALPSDEFTQQPSEPTSEPEIGFDEKTGIMRIRLDEKDIRFMSNGITLEQLGDCLNKKKSVVLEESGKDYRDALAYNSYFQEFDYIDKGINLLSYIEPYENTFGDSDTFTVVECNSDKVVFLGIKNVMNFKEIQECIAPTEVIRVEYGLPGLVSYELRYEINGIKIRFYAWDEKGENSFNVSIVKDFLDEYYFTRITGEQIGYYFSLSEDKLIELMGKELKYNKDLDEYVIDDAFFKFKNHILTEIYFPYNYEFENVRAGMSFDTIIGLLGKNEVKLHCGNQSDYYDLIYKYGNFHILFFSEFIDESPMIYFRRN